MSRTLGWFSSGAASAVACKLLLAEEWPQTEILNCDTGSEHPDNARFLAECAAWFGVPVIALRSAKYESIWQVFEKTKYLVGPKGARCTLDLKKAVRAAYQRPGDVHALGYTVEEEARALRFEKEFPELDTYWPLIEAKMTKADCFALLREVGIELPAMYKLGYRNNNCIGCVKGGMGYWNKIRTDFPEVFERMAFYEQTMGRTVLRDENGPVPLYDLDPRRGRYEAEPDISCGIACEMALDRLKDDIFS